jgi:hypothetical protein
VSSSFARAAVAALAVALLCAGCGGSKSHRRADVSAYVQRVNRIELVMRSELVDVEKAYRHFSTATLQRSRPRLVRAENTLRTLDQRLENVDPPRDARRLHRLMLQLVSAEVGLSHEVVQLAVFLPAFDDALRPLGPASVQLGQALAHAKAPAPRLVRGTKKQIAAARAKYAAAVRRAERAQADAIEQYANEIRVVQGNLSKLHPPPAVKPTFASERVTLARVRATGGALAKALRLGQSKRVATLDLRYRAAAQSGASLAAQRAEIAAVKSYDRRVRAVASMALRVQRELVRLDRTLHS